MWTNKDSSSLNLNLYSKQVGGNKCVMECEADCEPNCKKYCTSSLTSKPIYHKKIKELIKRRDDLYERIEELNTISARQEDDLLDKLQRNSDYLKSEDKKKILEVLLMEKRRSEEFNRRGGTRKRRNRKRGGNWFESEPAIDVKPCEEDCSKKCKTRCRMVCDDTTSSLFNSNNRIARLEKQIRQLEILERKLRIR
jgi:hypothetical protein